MLNLEFIRDQFPILKETINGKPLIYLDNAATTQKPLSVLECSRNYYERMNANIHRGVHSLSQIATAAYEEAREKAASFLNAKRSEEVLFTSGCTESINLVAYVLGESGRVGKDDEIIVSTMEHHSNIVPWQMLCERTGAQLRVIEIKESGELDMENFVSLLGSRTKVVAVAHVSNAMGVENPVEEMVRLVRANTEEALFLVDGAQSAPHMPVDVQAIGCDFFACSGHKFYAPTGTGLLWGRKEILDELPPWKGGGEMIEKVTFEKTTYNHLPFKYEAGTPNIEGGIAMGEAIGFMNSLGRKEIAEHESRLAAQCLEGLRNMQGLKIIGEASKRSAVISFVVDGVHHYDLGVLLDQMGIAVRTGHHCCQPLMSRYGISGTVRASFAVYNTSEEVDIFLSSLQKSLDMLR